MNSPPPLPNLRWRWTLGLALATLIAWGIAPHLTDSILLRHLDPELHDSVWQPDQTIRWRSEGWGTTRIGPEGLPGWTAGNQGQRILLWGDSQVEGFCVPDSLKLHAVSQKLAQADDLNVDFVPCGRSGTDARDWLMWKPVMESRFHPILHILIITDWNDLMQLAQPRSGPTLQPSSRSMELLAAYHGELFFHSAKKLLWDADSNRVRQLDWRLVPRSGPVPNSSSNSTSNSTHAIEPTDASEDPLSLITQRLIKAHQEGTPIALIYVPEVPQVQALAKPEDRHQNASQFLERQLSSHGITMVNLESPLIESYETTGQLPRGFQNGYPGLGHLNHRGNAIVAAAIVRLTSEHMSAKRVAPP